jgi:hypothetical protein
MKPDDEGDCIYSFLALAPRFFFSSSLAATLFETMKETSQRSGLNDTPVNLLWWGLQLETPEKSRNSGKQGSDGDAVGFFFFYENHLTFRWSQDEDASALRLFSLAVPHSAFFSNTSLDCQTWTAEQRRDGERFFFLVRLFVEPRIGGSPDRKVAIQHLPLLFRLFHSIFFAFP